MSAQNKLLTPPKPKKEKPTLQTPPKPKRPQPVSLLTPPAPKRPSPRLSSPVLPQRLNTPKRRGPRLNQLSRPTTPRRKPRTPQHPLRSSRTSPPRFEDDDIHDHPGHGSPLLFDTGDDTGFNFDNFPSLGPREPELSLNEKHKVIAGKIREVIPHYWDLLQEKAFSHARISERCFVVQDFNSKNGHLMV
jgi:hypothetical protein